ncbi:uncharacterized protein LOC110274446 [Arachis duranensis]|uniref:Uncharacterized protein LOC110274446 n=1 Tax=Arachis duranensis TaxID=130453 RepID=A0A9C6T422_ARADU|nr:uncharacterized protein LOC110274446 [Arachis duranensis]
MSSNDKKVEVSKGREEDEAEFEKEESVPTVTSKLFLKPSENQKPGNMDKEVVLRRIRHRRRVNKVRAAVGSFFSSPFSTDHHRKWVDDPFAAFSLLWHPNFLHLSVPVSVIVFGIVKLVVVLSYRVSLMVSRAFLVFVVAGDKSSRSQRFLFAVNFLCATGSWS